jgi:aminopeptidase N
MWLNEGFTVFCERKTTASLNKANPDIYKVSAYLGNASLWNDISDFGVNDSYSSLLP